MLSNIAQWTTYGLLGMKEKSESEALAVTVAILPD